MNKSIMSDSFLISLGPYVGGFGAATLQLLSFIVFSGSILLEEIIQEFHFICFALRSPPMIILLDSMNEIG